MSERFEDRTGRAPDDPRGTHPGAVLDEDQLTAHINRYGPPLIHRLFSASKTLQVHDRSNRAVRRAISELFTSLQVLFQFENSVRIRASQDFIVINDVRLSADPQSFSTFRYLMDEMKKRDMEGFELHSAVSLDELGDFLRCFHDVEPDDGVFDKLCGALRGAGIEHIQINQWVEREQRLNDEIVEQKDIHQESNRVFFRTAALVGEVLRGIGRRRVIQVRKAERLTQQMVDIIRTDETILVGLTSIKNFDEYTFLHSVNVCVLSMLIGDRLGLYKSDVARLGVAALFHDIGKTYIPQTILNKPGKLSEQDWELMKYHTFFGAKELSRIKALREMADALFATLQHHVHYDMNGYPSRPSGWNLRLFSRIITVADYFDAMTTPRVYTKEPFTPDRALRFVLDKSGQIFDPLVAKAFIRVMGLYPIGTIVALDNGERAIVVRQNKAACYMHRPVVVRMGGTGTIDLTESSSAGTGYLRSIVRAVHDVGAEAEKTSCFVSE